MKIKNLLFRGGAGLATIGIIVAGAAAFSAFEAHVVNVTATIENALTVPVEQNGLTFGEMFPEEVATTTLPISLSTSFMSTDRVDDVEYEIRQKPKCGVPVTLDVASGTPISYSSYTQVTEDANGNFVCPSGSVQLPLLCPYLSKHEENADGSDSTNGIDAFHGLPGPWTEATTENTEVTGVLSKQLGKTSTNWDIDLHTPCFAGECSQDWASYVTNTNPAVTDPTIYEADPANEHQEFGCDLWVEVTNISLPTTTPGTGLLTVTKVVDNSNGGGSDSVSDFPLFVDGISVISGSTTVQTVGPHVVTETTKDGYTGVFSGACDSEGNVIVSTSTTASCILTNTPPPIATGTLTVIKHVDNGNVSTTTSASDFTMHITGGNPSSNDFAGSESGTVVTLNAGQSYSVSESGPGGYAESDSADCLGTLTAGENATCTVTNSIGGGTITVIKVVSDVHNLTTQVPSNFQMTIDGVSVDQNTTVPVSIGSHTIGEVNDEGDTVTYSGDCDGTDQVTIASGDAKTCTVTNTVKTSPLIVQKIVNNTHGGTATTSSFTYYVGSKTVTSGQVNYFLPGTYPINEAGVPGYTASFSGACNGVNSVTLVATTTVSTCTITNNDIPPVITLNTVVSNGAATTSDFSLFIDGVFVPSGSSEQVTSNTSHSITVALDAAASGYTNTVSGSSAYHVNCPSTLPGTLTLSPGDSIVCTVTETH